MELNLNKTPVPSLLEVLNTVSEQPVDIDFTLPDYCPDIERILRCKITPKIYNRNISGGQLHIEGATVISVLYEDSENKTIRACEQSQPFSTDLRINDSGEDYVIEASTKCEYVNCRALSRRRMTVHGAFSLYVKVLSKGTIDLYSPDDSENIEFKSKELTASKLSALSSEQFSVTDEIQITGKPPVEIIIDSDVKANITDYKVIPDKLMLNGELNVRVLYISDVESGKPEQLDYIIPFSEVIDCEGLSDDSCVCVNLSVMSSDLSLKSDILSENPLISVDARLCVSVIGYESEQAFIAADAYSTEFCSEPNFLRVNVPTKTTRLGDTFMHKDTISLNDCDIAQIIDISAAVCPMATSISEGKLVVNNTININILAFDSENSPIYIERSVDVSRELETDEDFNKVVCSGVSLLNLSYRLGDEKTIDLRCELKYSLTLQNVECFNMVKSLNVDENTPLKKKSSALTLYYADKDESIWEIAKLFKTRQVLIIEENELSAETLEEPQMLLIPTV